MKHFKLFLISFLTFVFSVSVNAAPITAPSSMDDVTTSIENFGTEMIAIAIVIITFGIVYRFIMKRS